MNQTETGTVPVPHRLDKIESALELVTGTLDRFGALISGLIPAAAPVVAGVDAVGHVAEGVINTIEGTTSADAAALAAGQISVSTGNPALDARLIQIESILSAAVPLLRFVAKEFGESFDVPTAAPMAVAAVATTEAPAVAVTSEG